MAGAGVKLLNKRIRSVKNTQQITKAMKMVAASKLNRSQGNMLAARPYSQKLTELMQQLAGKTDIADPLFEVRPIKRRLYLIIASDKGLCGSYNMNVLKLATKAVDASVAEGVETEIYAVGKKVADFFRKRDYTIWDRHIDFGGEINSERGNLVGNNMVRAFTAGEFDEVRVVYASFVSTMTQKPVDEAMLPIAPDQSATGNEDEEDNDRSVDYIWEPSQEEMFKILLPLYLRNRVFMTLSEAFTSEHAARMTSMSAATENAGELIGALTLQRNRERQSAITAELLDIVGGANAL
ncbi:ATP synthase F1 subunit gamma [bacterium DOLZORAL124_64_63]|nr:MAG: ATP synthase F1 subunit gamma [bacterium DOLZORAL124_64_63]